jgi:hypothetical protein
MLFLLNDRLLRLEPHDIAAPLRAAHVQALSFDFVMQLGRELFAEEPLLAHAAPATARRLAALIVARQPEINAALFVAPAKDCDPDEVQVRFVAIGLEIMSLLHERQEAGNLTNVYADRQVWRRLAA